MHENLQSRYNDVHGHYMSLYEEAKLLIYSLERKEHDVNYLKSKLTENPEADKNRILDLANLKLQKELNSSKAANDHLQKMWLDTQKETLKCKEKLQKLSQDYATLNSRLKINDVIKVKTQEDIEKINQNEVDAKFESANLYAELRKLQPIVDELRKKNVTLERQLVDARFKLEEASLDENVFFN